MTTNGSLLLPAALSISEHLVFLSWFIATHSTYSSLQLTFHVSSHTCKVVKVFTSRLVETKDILRESLKLWQAKFHKVYLKGCTIAKVSSGLFESIREDRIYYIPQLGPEFGGFSNLPVGIVSLEERCVICCQILSCSTHQKDCIL